MEISTNSVVNSVAAADKLNIFGNCVSSIGASASLLLCGSSASECRNLRVILRLGDAALRRTSKDISGAGKLAKSEVSTNVSIFASASTTPLPSFVDCNILAIAVLDDRGGIGVALKRSWDAAAAISLGEISIEDVKTFAL